MNNVEAILGITAVTCRAAIYTLQVVVRTLVTGGVKKDYLARADELSDEYNKLLKEYLDGVNDE